MAEHHICAIQRPPLPTTINYPEAPMLAPLRCPRLAAGCRMEQLCDRHTWSATPSAIAGVVRSDFVDAAIIVVADEQADGRRMVADDLLNPFVSRVNRRDAMRTLKFWRSISRSSG